MVNVKIRPLTPEDLPNLEPLIATRDDIIGEDAVDKRLQLIRWLAFKNPFANGDPTYFVAHDNGKIVAHLGRMPMQFIIKGARRKGYFVHDLYVHPEYRTKGMGLFISQSLYKEVEKESDSFCCLVWTTDLNLKLQQIRGYYQTWTDRYYKFFNPYPKLRKLIKSDVLAKVISLVIKCALWMVDSVILNFPSEKVSVSKIRSFDSRFDNLNPHIFQKTGICPHKTREYLNWRFLGHPFGEMEVFVASDDEVILGFAVVCTTSTNEYLQGVLLDIMADPEDVRTITSLCKEVVKHFRKNKVCTILCCLSDKRFAKILKRFFFIRDFVKQEPVMLANLDKCEDKDYLKEISNWHLTCCASDYLMLEPLWEGSEVQQMHDIKDGQQKPQEA